MEKLALFGGERTVKDAPMELFSWPIITEEDEAAALDVIRNNKFSGYDITQKFEEEFAAWQGRKYAVAYCNGTAALTASMFAIGLSMGDEIICTTKTYWASVSQSLTFGATPVFCNIDEHLSMDPDDIERCITPKTKAIMVVHYLAYPCDMDRIMEIANRHNLIVMEDVSHAQGGLYKGKKLGTFGQIAAMSLMSTKSFAAGELGIVVCDDKKLFERVTAFGHYDRNTSKYITESEDLFPFFSIPLGGIKGRANQLCTAMARVQLKYYDERCAEIRRAMNYFWDLLDGLPGIRAIRVDESTGSNMAGWYMPHGIYKAEELGGLSVRRFCEAVSAEGGMIWDGANRCLHTHPLFHDYDYFGVGKPTRIAFSNRDAREDDKLLDRSTEITCFSVPWFKHYDKEWIERFAASIRKVIENYDQLLEGDAKKAQGGRWYGQTNED
ncbi:MAG: aminotransferase class I/II-fold pyridoxal phosphate-dependent enzyme [Ruminococcaceae bacterium]|nr:aminotransferase class I/II-fold pyridoxal phosphate-dependent enzyme [Oscillospiraceae bacterium]